MNSRCLSLAALCFVGALVHLPAERSANAQAPQTPPTFSSSVELITVDAVVLDANGRPVPGLTQDDFVVTEDGRPRDIASFEAFVLGTPVEAPPPSAVASNAPAPRGLGRAFAILLDDVKIAPMRTEVARRTVLAFLDRSVRDGDEVMLATSSGDVWWSARIPEGREDLLAVLSRVKGRDLDPPAIDRLTDYEAFRIHNYEDTPAFAGTLPTGPASSLPARATGQVTEAPPPGGQSGLKERVKKRWLETGICQPTNCDGMVRARAAELDERRRGRMRLTLQSIRRGLDALSLVHGRKSLLLLSDGFLQDSGTQLREVAAASREGNTAIYFLDLRGLVAIPGFGSAADAGIPPDPRDQSAMSFEEIALASGGADALADDTGGFSVRNTNDLGAGIESIADESRVFYLLGFYPPEGKSEREWRKLNVEVKKPGLKVRARRGYTLRAAAGPGVPKPDKKGKAKAKTEPDPAVQKALDATHDMAGIPLRAMAYVFEPRPRNMAYVVVAVELDATRLTLRPKGKSQVARLDVSVVASNRDSGRGFRHDDTIEFPVEGPDAPGWRSFAREFELPSGVTQARVVVRDVTSGALGSVSQRFEIPLPSDLHVSTPILTDRVAAKSKGQARPQPALAVHRVFAPAGLLYCQFEVFGATRAPGTAAPQVAAGIELRTRDGRVVRRADVTPIAADADGRLVRMVGMALDGMDEGTYELVLEVRDEVSGTHLERREPFTLAGRKPRLARFTPEATSFGPEVTSFDPEAPARAATESRPLPAEDLLDRLDRIGLAGRLVRPVVLHAGKAQG